MTEHAFQELFNHPKRTAMFIYIVVLMVWFSVPTFCGTLLFLVLNRLLKIAWYWIVGLGFFLALVTSVEAGFLNHSWNAVALITDGFYVNGTFWKLLILSGEPLSALIYLLDGAFLYLVGTPLLIAGGLSLLELVPLSAHERQLLALQRGKMNVLQEVKPATLKKALRDLPEVVGEGTALGVSKTTGHALIVPDLNLNQIILVLGTTGAGKSVTLRRFYQRAIAKGYPLIIVNGKPTDEEVTWVEQLATRYQRSLSGFNCANYLHYDPLAQGGYTELKDKIISLKDEWSSDYYRTIAEDYLQTTFEVLLATGEKVDLKRVIACLDYDELALVVRKLNNPTLAVRVKRLSNYENKDITGLQAHLSLLIHSEMGSYFEHAENKTFSLQDVINKNGVVYFALPALRFPSFSRVLGKLVINDIKATIDRTLSHQKIFTVFDEFSVFAGEQVLNLVNMGRGKGVHAILGTQGMGDLQAVSPVFASQVTNCANTLICHRLNDDQSVKAVTAWAGTHDAFDVTAQISAEKQSSGLGSVSRNKEFIVHPDAVKQDLQPGEAFYITKVGRFYWDKIKVKST